MSWKTLILITSLALPLSFGTLGSGCMHAYQKSVGSDAVQTFHRIFLTDYNTAWLSVLDSLKSSAMDVTDRQAGTVLTKWTDNTAERNFNDSVSGVNAYLNAQYRFNVSVSRGFYNGQPSVKVTVLKEQLVKRDVLEGWRPMETDSIDENTLLYRIGRLIQIKMALAKLEEQKLKREIENTKFR